MMLRLLADEVGSGPDQDSLRAIANRIDAAARGKQDENDIPFESLGWIATFSVLIKHPEVTTEGAACDYVSETIRSLNGIEDWAYVPGGQPRPYEIPENYAEGQAFDADDPRPLEDEKS